jgi:hypothetical protein
MVRHQRLTVMEREEISRLLAVGHSLRATANVLGRAPSTLVRELARHRMSSLTVSGGDCPSAGVPPGASASEAEKARSSGPLAGSSLPALGPAVVARTDCPRPSTALS